MSDVSEAVERVRVRAWLVFDKGVGVEYVTQAPQPWITEKRPLILLSDHNAQIARLTEQVRVANAAREQAAVWLDDLAEVVGSKSSRAGSHRRWKYNMVKEWARRTRETLTRMEKNDG